MSKLRILPYIFLFLAATLLLSADYIFITNYIHKAKQESAQKRHEQIAAEMARLDVDMREAGMENAVLSPRLKMLCDSAKVDYLLLLSDDNSTMASCANNIPEQELARLPEAYAAGGYSWPGATDVIHVMLANTLYHSRSAILAHMGGAHIVYGTSAAGGDDVARHIRNINFYLMALALSCLAVASLFIYWRSGAKPEEAAKVRAIELDDLKERLRQESAGRHLAEQALAGAEARYQEMVNNSTEGIVQIAPDGRIISANAAMARILGYDSADALLEAYKQPGGHISYTVEMHQAISELLEVRGWVKKMEFQAAMRDGTLVWVSVNARRVWGLNGETLYYEAFIEDIASRKQTEEKLVHQAFHDPLTGLPNRALFMDRLRMAIRRAKRHNEYIFAVLHLDLDNFKSINDTFGHRAGDKILNRVTERLLQCVRDADTVARFSGDEFALLIADLERPAQAVHIAKRISKALSDVIVFNGQDIRISASMGIFLNSAGCGSPEEVLRDADTAMYRAKRHGRGRFAVFNKRMREETMSALVIESDLRGAVERKEIEVHYQPLVQTADGKVYGFEALMRWRRNGEMVGPLTFIPIAEETGLINELGLELLKMASLQIIEWNKALGHDNFNVHVNISGKQLMARRFWRDALAILEKSGVNPRQLVFEITESVFLDYGSQVISAMGKLREAGIRFCLDDFGTGFSSFSYLRLMPLDSLKVDRSFIMDLPADSPAESIVRNLVSLGKDLGLDVIAEGIEQCGQADLLRSIGCMYAQGYYFSRPLIPSDALDYLLRHDHGNAPL